MLRQVVDVQAVVGRAEQGHEVFACFGFFPHANRRGTDFRHPASAPCFDALANRRMALAALLNGHGDVRVFHGISGYFDHEFLCNVDLFHLDFDHRAMSLFRFGFLSGEGFGLCGLRGLDLHALSFRHGGRRFSANRCRRLGGVVRYCL